MSATAALMGAHLAGPWMFGWWFLLVPLVWIGLFALVFAVFGRRWRRRAMADGFGPGAAPSRRAETVLAERFARGDIDEVEYRARLEVLRTGRDG